MKINTISPVQKHKTTQKKGNTHYGEREKKQPRQELLRMEESFAVKESNSDEAALMAPLRNNLLAVVICDVTSGSEAVQRHLHCRIRLVFFVESKFTQKR